MLLVPEETRFRPLLLALPSLSPFPLPSVSPIRRASLPAPHPFSPPMECLTDEVPSTKGRSAALGGPSRRVRASCPAPGGHGQPNIRGGSVNAGCEDEPPIRRRPSRRHWRRGFSPPCATSGRE